MKKKSLILIGHAEWDDEVNDFYKDRFTPALAYEADEGDTVLNENPAPTLVELANFLDAKAEARNNHDYIRLHKVLAVFLYLRLGEEVATALMREIAEFGGLDGMNDVGTFGSWREGGAFEDLGITDDGWEEWSLPGPENNSR